MLKLDMKSKIKTHLTEEGGRASVGCLANWARELYLINCLLSVEELALSLPIRRSMWWGRYPRPPLDCSHLIDTLETV